MSFDTELSQTMSNKVAPDSGEVKAEPETDSKVKHMIVWDAADWRRIQTAHERVKAETHLDSSVPDYIRGAVQKRNDEILGPEAA